MPTFEFCVETKREVTVAIADRLRYDKPAVGDKEEDEGSRKIVRMSLRFRDPHGGGREDDITDWDERDLYGKGIGIPTIVRGVELAACRDAAYRFGGDCVYSLAFHAKHYNNRSTFVFKVPGGQEIQHLAIVPGRGGGMMHGMHGRGEDTGFAERIMPDLLKYVDNKEERIDKKYELVFGTLVKQVQQLSSVVTEYTDRELKLREIALNADDHQYERDKKRREDEESAKIKREGMEFLKDQVVPEVLPYVIQAIQRFSSGPGGYTEAPDFQKWYEAQKAQREAHQKNGQNGQANGQNGGGAQNGPGGAVESQGGEVVGETVGDGVGEPLEPSMYEKLQLRVALETVQFVGLLRTRNKFDAAREALTDAQRTLFDEIAAAGATADLDDKKGVEEVAKLALMFGAAVQADPATGFKLLGAVDGMCKISLVELSNLLKMYYEATEAKAKEESREGTAGSAVPPEG